AHPGEDLLVHLGDAQRRADQTVAVGILADRLEDLAHRVLDPVHVDGLRGRGAVGGRWDGAGVGHAAPPERRGLSDAAAAALLRLGAGVAPSGRTLARGSVWSPASHICTSANSSWTRSASNVSCTINSRATRSRTSRLPTSTCSAAACAESMRVRTSASMLAATSSA